MGSPRVDIVFRLWQCDKENHGWREGPPQTVLPSSIRWLAFTLLVSQRRTKKEYCFLPTSARPPNCKISRYISYYRQLVRVLRHGPRCLFRPGNLGGTRYPGPRGRTGGMAPLGVQIGAREG
jgi:hypothetical protein